MGKFKSNRGGGFGGRPGRFGRDSGRSDEMFDATCSNCGKQCRVPFRPTGSKPVYCDDCFKQQNSSRDSAKAGMSADQFNQINGKLDKILKVLQDLELDVDEDYSEEESEEDEDEEEEDDQEEDQ